MAYDNERDECRGIPFMGGAEIDHLTWNLIKLLGFARVPEAIIFKSYFCLQVTFSYPVRVHF